MGWRHLSMLRVMLPGRGGDDESMFNKDDDDGDGDGDDDDDENINNNINDNYYYYEIKQ